MLCNFQCTRECVHRESPKYVCKFGPRKIDRGSQSIVILGTWPRTSQAIPMWVNRDDWSVHQGRKRRFLPCRPTVLPEQLWHVPHLTIWPKACLVGDALVLVHRGYSLHVQRRQFHQSVLRGLAIPNIGPIQVANLPHKK